VLGRPPVPLGTFGRIAFVTKRNGQIEARARFRDFDGSVRLVATVAPSRSAAERLLKTEMVTRQAPAGVGSVAPSTRLDALSEVWLACPHGWSTGTTRTYTPVVRNQVKPALGRLRVSEVTPGTVTRALRGIADRSGPGAAKTARACLSGMFAMAIEDGAPDRSNARSRSVATNVVHLAVGAPSSSALPCI
jgi:hypothetical protein